ncbi:MAG TPA: molybdopterin converting factor subunit 1 [Thiobacillaceae bacterium]|nr:molybdopterin converting factor subunit 1 [Thiobacillaceae bacterium]HNA81052.1 molybdopterin converting factor subunit 1 [Thiobacillaceae bacterium]HNF87755.1 molybdopterin converting factor subunit 1 [Thiobacillaceae bacterium]HNH88061.1 molybdopterin converting factor subunit 1 [Thiobacillaceae bacterium]HNI06621.1 molybdopterin converting factor subunit 1 [Thiobacillaceae bacterium]
MHIRLLYFARLREALGLDRESLDLEDAACLADLLAVLRARGGAWAEELGEGRNFRLAVNQDIAVAETPLGDGDEVAIFPPVTGG